MTLYHFPGLGLKEWQLPPPVSYNSPSGHPEPLCEKSNYPKMNNTREASRQSSGDSLGPAVQPSSLRCQPSEWRRMRLPRPSRPARLPVECHWVTSVAPRRVTQVSPAWIPHLEKPWDVIKNGYFKSLRFEVTWHRAIRIISFNPFITPISQARKFKLRGIK